MTEQNQTQRLDAGKPPYHLLPSEFIKFAYANPQYPYADVGDDIGLPEALSQLEDWVQNPEAGPDQLPLPSIGKELDDTCYVLGFGAKKYAPHQWERNPLVYSRVYRSARSHALKEIANPGSLDEESGLPHLAHFYANLMFLVTYQLRGYTNLDDRPDVRRTAGPEALVAFTKHAVDSALKWIEETDPVLSGRNSFGTAKATFTPKAGERARLVRTSTFDGFTEDDLVGKVVTVQEILKDDEFSTFDCRDDCGGLWAVGRDAVWERP